MNKHTKKKERLFITDLLTDPAVTYPAYYLLSPSMARNEMLLSSLEALHSFDFNYYTAPQTHADIFAMFAGGGFPIYLEKYIVGYFGGRMMVLESHGWKSMTVTEAVFEMGNWWVY
jgi:hypothetical protein